MENGSKHVERFVDKRRHNRNQIKPDYYRTLINTYIMATELTKKYCWPLKNFDGDDGDDGAFEAVSISMDMAITGS